MQNRFAGAIMKWLQQNTVDELQSSFSLPFLQHFQFNKQCSITERFKIPTGVIKVDDAILELRLPSFIPVKAIAAPAHTRLIECTISAASSPA